MQLKQTIETHTEILEREAGEIGGGKAMKALAYAGEFRKPYTCPGQDIFSEKT